MSKVTSTVGAVSSTLRRGRVRVRVRVQGVEHLV